MALAGLFVTRPEDDLSEGILSASPGLLSSLSGQSLECKFHALQLQVRIFSFRATEARMAARLSVAASDLVDVRRRWLSALCTSSLLLGANWGAGSRISVEEEASDDFP